MNQKGIKNIFEMKTNNPSQTKRSTTDYPPQTSNQVNQPFKLTPVVPPNREEMSRPKMIPRTLFEAINKRALSILTENYDDVVGSQMPTESMLEALI